MSRVEIVEFRVRLLVKDSQEAEAVMYNAFSRQMGATWSRTDTPVRVLEAPEADSGTP
jgi:hypothetical protein